MQRVSESLSYSKFSPSFDVKEDKDHYLLEGEIPGIEHKDVVVEFSDDRNLTLIGHTEYSRDEGELPGRVAESKDVAQLATKSTYWMSERSVGEFARSFSFPNRVDQGNVKASLRNGVLGVVVPKLAR